MSIASLPTASGKTEILAVSGLGKTYVEPVVKGIQLEFHAGEVLALVGENGAGKSTLSKIIAGIVEPTDGQMRFLGEAYRPRNRREAEEAGIRMVMQELNLVPTLSIAENILLRNLPNRAGWVSRRRLREQAREVMTQVGLGEIDPETLVCQLGLGHQQMVEIARNLVGSCRVLILDEPTAMLTPREVTLLFQQIERLKQQGVALIYISHRLDELAHIAERFAVLRDGSLVKVDRMDRFTSSEMIRLMIGREVGEHLDFGQRHVGKFAVRDMARGCGTLDHRPSRTHVGRQAHRCVTYPLPRAGPKGLRTQWRQSAKSCDRAMARAGHAGDAV